MSLIGPRVRHDLAFTMSSYPARNSLSRGQTLKEHLAINTFGLPADQFARLWRNQPN
jgi:hypothetical protein